MRVPRRALPLFAALSLSATALLGGPPAEAAASASTTSSASTTEARFVARVNAVRTQHGLARLRMRAGLMTYAQRHSATMSRSRTLFHAGVPAELCCRSSVSENVGTGGTVRGLHRAFMSSPAHRANLLDPRKRGVGVGVVRVGGRIWVTEVFRHPR